MSNASEPSNVVDLSQRLDPRSDRVGALLATVRGLATKRLHALASNMFENIDDALFDLAEKAENNAAQTQFFDGMREVRKKRAIVERTFLGQVARDLADFSAGRLRAPETDSHTRPLANIELSLVGENELEESLAVTSMVGKNEQRLARALFAVNQRLSVICGGNKMDDASNPVGPASLANAFRQALRELLVEVRVKLIIYKLFDRYVLAGIDELYDDINNELAAAGVLPQLRHEISTRRSDAPAPTGPDSTATPVAHGPAAPVTDAAAAEFMHSLHALFSARRGAMPADMSGAGVAASGVPIPLGPLPSPAELLGALTLLQSQISVLPASAAHLASQGEMARDVAQLKEQLLTQIGQLRGQHTAHVSGVDEDTIDLVGMLFEFILEDRNLPAEMQVLLARLQIPYLKVALLDRRMFAHKSHPARQLLDALADAAKGWSAEGDRDGRLFDKVKSIVERLLHEFDDDIAIFDRLAAELQEFLDVARKRAELAEQRVAESTRGREKLEQARRRAAQEIVGRTAGANLPPLIYGVLTRAWANYVVLTLLRQGEESTEFADSLRFIDHFVASARPVHDTNSRRDLRALLPGIERSLRRGLASVAFQEADTEQLLAQLHAFYRTQLGETAPETESGTLVASVMPLPEAIQAIEEPVLEPEPEDEGEVLADEAFDERYLSQARELKVGQWLEFTADDGTTDRAKLSWVSPISGRFLFVNRRGLKVADHSLAGLAQAFAQGTARVLDSTLLFDRAMDAIVERLRTPENA
ncbi:DUF1631 domain-containing protein [Luteibacter aegosomatissinici]|uniref:DUF1631 domain-containing protein n=1 Tax=Luteibacter aegosomatissinici TaxID=2911539 RepID=UPI001FF75CD1|nr:DUF1631 domain-containing protein [Luteibacter aegosomatissinici]UPG95713.1 DUF1631 domain-containing protein [Luteibacter aegosomatissinici]